MDFLQEQNNKIQYIEDILQQYLPKEESYQKTIMEAMKYSVMAGGKRIRPMLMLETFTLCGGTGKIIEAFMAAIEFIHTYSLVHDDLPAMDDDDYRRGRLTTHKKYGEAIGILAGDSLLNYAFEIITQENQTYIHNAPLILKAIHTLAVKSGIYGMIGGQVVDIESVNKNISQEKLEYIYELKTSALIEASMMIGVILAGSDISQIHKMEKIAKNIGMAFQIQDDILDVTSTVEELGKPINSDEKNNKTTYVTLIGIEKAKAIVEELSVEAINDIKQISDNSEFLIKLVLSLINRRK